MLPNRPGPRAARTLITRDCPRNTPAARPVFDGNHSVARYVTIIIRSQTIIVNLPNSNTAVSGSGRIRLKKFVLKSLINRPRRLYSDKKPRRPETHLGKRTLSSTVFANTTAQLSYTTVGFFNKTNPTPETPIIRCSGGGEG